MLLCNTDDMHRTELLAAPYAIKPYCKWQWTKLSIESYHQVKTNVNQ